jgi:hypothetical protein
MVRFPHTPAITLRFNSANYHLNCLKVKTTVILPIPKRPERNIEG